LDRMNDVTRVLSAIEQGDPHAADQLLPLVYDELRKLAAQKLAQEKPGQTLQATRVVEVAPPGTWDATALPEKRKSVSEVVRTFSCRRPGTPRDNPRHAVAAKGGRAHSQYQGMIAWYKIGYPPDSRIPLGCSRTLRA
jgi:hypothetical protein